MTFQKLIYFIQMAASVTYLKLICNSDNTKNDTVAWYKYGLYTTMMVMPRKASLRKLNFHSFKLFTNIFPFCSAFFLCGQTIQELNSYGWHSGSDKERKNFLLHAHVSLKAILHCSCTENGQKSYCSVIFMCSFFLHFCFSMFLLPLPLWLHKVRNLYIQLINEHIIIYLI